VVLFGLFITVYVSPAVGVRSGDPWQYLAALAWGGFILFAVFYVVFTGKPMPPVPALS
jgi:hypothetical protein